MNIAVNGVDVQSYELKIISQDEISKGKVLKQYDVNGEKVVGCYENEPFTIMFVNKSWNKVQVKFSIDGTDVLTGKLADTSKIGKMWVVQPYGTLELKAFPETNKGGAEFIFGQTKDSVAVNTHGVKTGIGYIAAAVFIEEPIVNMNYYPYTLGQINVIPIDYPNTYLGGTGTFNTICEQNEYSVFSSNSAITKSAAAVGAGDYVAQEVVETAGLSKPILSSILTVKYEWWTSLRSKIRQQKEVINNPAFPGDKPVTKMIDLKETPRKVKSKKITKVEKYPELNRFGK